MHKMAKEVQGAQEAPEAEMAEGSNEKINILQ